MSPEDCIKFSVLLVIVRCEHELSIVWNALPVLNCVWNWHGSFVPNLTYQPDKKDDTYDLNQSDDGWYMDQKIKQKHKILNIPLLYKKRGPDVIPNALATAEPKKPDGQYQNEDHKEESQD